MTWIVWLKVTSIALMSAFVAWKAWIWQHDAKITKKVETNIVQRSQKEGAARAKQASKAHDTAKRPGAFERLRADPETCPDCKRAPVR